MCQSAVCDSSTSSSAPSTTRHPLDEFFKNRSALSLSLSVSAPLKKEVLCLPKKFCLLAHIHTLRERTEEAVVFKKAAHTHSLAYTTSQPALKLPVCVRAAKPQTGAFCVSSNNTPSHTHTDRACIRFKKTENYWR
jgi:hypothetical protein